MKLSKKQLALAVVSAVTVGTALAQQPQKIEKIEVTGSNIKRVDSEGPQPVAIITKEEIAKKGVASTNDLLRSLSYMSSFNDELTVNSPNASGTAAAGFRGLAGDQTVVLLNGRRLANYGFDGQFTDLNTIPLSAIERVEVLKDGASAIYGADAIGGVINFITRRDFRGAEVSVGYGRSSRGDADETTASGTIGFGDYTSQRFNVMLNANYFKREPIFNLDRERTSTADYRRFGGSNQLSTFAPTGNVRNPVTNLWEPYQPCPSPDLLVTPSPLGPGTTCAFDFAPFRPTIFGTDRMGFLGSASFKLAENHRLFAEALYSKTENDLQAAPAPANINIPAGNPINRFNTAVTVRGRPLQAGPRITNNEAEATRFVVGLDGALANYDYSISVGQAKNKATNNDSGYFLTDRLFAAIGAGTFNPFLTNNSATVLASIAATPVRKGETSYDFVEGKLSGELASLPAGPLGFAVGVNFGKDKLSDVPNPDQQAGNIFGSIAQSAAVGSRDSRAAYAELAVPIIKNLEAQLAVRYDSYEGGTKSTTPKVAMRYQPVQQVLFRASYAEGFKMPSLRDLFGGQNQSADSVQDFPGCAARGVTRAACPRLQYDRFSGGNPGLKPEQSESYNIGILIEPNANFNIGIDYFIIDKEDEIGLVPTQYVIDNVPYRPGTFTPLAGSIGVTRDAGGTIVNVITGQGNLGARKIRGVDFSTAFKTKLGVADVNLGFNATVYDKYDYADLPGDPLYGRLGLLNLPRYKWVATSGMEYGPWSGGLTYTFTPAMWDKPQSTAATPVGPSDRRVGEFGTLDLVASYKGFKGMTIGAGVKNVLDKEPPFSNNDTRAYGFAAVHDIRGRYFYGTISYKFY